MSTEISRTKISASKAIRSYYLEGTELTEKQEAIRKRWSAAFALLCNYHSIQQAIPVHMKEFQVSEAQAYRDINEALRLYGNVIKSEKAGHRMIVYEFAVKTFQLAAKNHDYKAMNMATANMIKVLGLDRDDPEMPDFANLQPSLNLVVIDPAAEKQMLEMLKNGPIDLSNLQTQNETIEDVEHEEIDDAAGAAK